MIDKDALVAEIDRRLADNKKEIERASHKNLEDYFEGHEDALTLFKDQYLDTLEVKEVDLQKEIQTQWKGCEPIDEGMGCEFANISVEQFDSIAKHFFELGKKASNPLTWEDMLIIHKCIKDAMNYHLYAFRSADGQQKVYEEVLKRFKAQKGEKV